ncbi:class A beta-lactamase [Clostridium chrysemydis]|uniref:class A beta-lactamase n=1 Tax=Clostridium chrysemydis TaxID=2665504 RepID=UPI003F40CA42
MSKLKSLKTLSLIALLFVIIFSVISCSDKKEEVLEKQKEEVNYNSEFKKIEEKYGVKLGIYALDENTNKEVTYNEDSRFAYCSTSKALLAGAILEKYSLKDLDKVIKYSEKDILSYAPITKEHVKSGMTIKELCEAAIRSSDNTAANLLFNLLGGPKGFKESLLKIGDNITRPERIEPELNSIVPGDSKDTSTPKQLALDLKEYLTGDTLSNEKKELLKEWMSKNKTGDNLIRKGFTSNFEVFDKSGAGDFGTRNDIAMVTSKDKKPIFISILSTKKEKDSKYNDSVISDSAKVISDYFNN